MLVKRFLFSNTVHVTEFYRVSDGPRSLVLVVFIGGVTFAEISALRFLSAQVYFSSWCNFFLLLNSSTFKRIDGTSMFSCCNTIIYFLISDSKIILMERRIQILNQQCKTRKMKI